MRLLEFNRDAGGANPQSQAGKQAATSKTARPVRLAKASTTPAKPAPETAAPEASTPEKSAAGKPAPGKPVRVLPLKAGKTSPQARKPIDLEQLQQRIEVLERRLLARHESGAEHPAGRDLELLKQRVARLQQSVHSELWAAKQREHTMLTILSKPSFAVAMKQRLERCRDKQLPAAGRWCMAAARQWWQECQPEWWAGFARAWHDSLNKARGLPRD